MSEFANLLRSRHLVAWGFLAPAMFFLGIFVFIPILYLAGLSVTGGSFTRSGAYWVGWQNYERLLFSSDFWQVLGNTIYFTVATVLPSLVIPLMVAVGLNAPMRGRTILRTGYFLPSIVSIVAAGLGFRWLFQSEGPVNAILGNFGLVSVSWLGSTVWAMPVLILLSIWKQLGFNMVVFLAGLQTIPLSLYEAARLDGAGAWQQFRYVTLPGLQPTLVLSAVTTTIFTLRSFEQVYVVTGGGPLNTTNLLVYYIYQQAFGMFDFGYAAAAAMVLLVATLVLIWIQLKTWQQS